MGEEVFTGSLWNCSSATWWAEVRLIRKKWGLLLPIFPAVKYVGIVVWARQEWLYGKAKTACGLFRVCLARTEDVGKVVGVLSGSPAFWHRCLLRILNCIPLWESYNSTSKITFWFLRYKWNKLCYSACRRLDCETRSSNYQMVFRTERVLVLFW